MGWFFYGKTFFEFTPKILRFSGTPSGLLAPYINNWMKTIKAESEKGDKAEMIIYIVCGIIALAAVAYIVVALKKKT